MIHYRAELHFKHCGAWLGAVLVQRLVMKIRHYVCGSFLLQMMVVTGIWITFYKRNNSLNPFTAKFTGEYYQIWNEFLK